MCYSSHLCSTMETFLCLLVLVVLSECRHMEKRNVLLIVGTKHYFIHVAITAENSVAQVVQNLLQWLKI